MKTNRSPSSESLLSSAGDAVEKRPVPEMTAKDSGLADIITQIETFFFTSDSRASKVLRDIQKASGFSRRVFFLLGFGVFHLMLLGSNSTAALANLLVISYPLYLTFKHLMNPESKLGPLLVFWAVYAVYTQLLAMKPNSLLYTIQPVLFFYLWCPATQGARSLHFRLFAPLCEFLIQGRFSAELWIQLYPWLARLLYGAGFHEFGYLKEQFSATQLAELKLCLKRARSGNRSSSNTTARKEDFAGKVALCSMEPASNLCTAISVQSPSTTTIVPMNTAVSGDSAKTPLKNVASATTAVPATK
ncbi:hypothetical protein QR680_009789 [Steinernema hermaphroditum]|uniref:Receptor expression-enhancing protein n=1 Tax=Steinernema hermaphroditum TaxID=289476 RepID=A0AA39ILN4_9BILA|nr:hypothetical protein QR680_009789 [Steinernema hermaphroditum]